MSTQRTLLGVLLGLTAGAAIGILLAPRSGKETRILLKKKGVKAKEDLSDLLDQGYEQWKKARNTIVERANMTKADIKDFLGFMSAEGADLKDRIASDVKSSAKNVANAGKRAVDPASHN
ncbi:MAG: YtxH domain-containing protein [Flavobacteriales bacterium]|nr:YtxH domain-containing protein [Flavobacteriales bacterium]